MNKTIKLIFIIFFVGIVSSATTYFFTKNIEPNIIVSEDNIIKNQAKKDATDVLVEEDVIEYSVGDTKKSEIKQAQAPINQEPIIIVNSNYAPIINGCQIYPSDNTWNTDISNYSIHPKSNTYIQTIGLTKGLHPDFGENQDYGIPYNIVSNQTKVHVTFTEYGDESDAGPYPIPQNPKMEAMKDAHLIVLDTSECKLYEMYNAKKSSNGSWLADSGAIFNLKSNALRPEGFTSADAAGLPIFPGLVRYEEIEAGEIKHAIRFTANHTQAGWIHPATHKAGTDNSSYPPMGLRVRLKANYDISGFNKQAQIILTAMKKYGMILADNGSDWFFSGATDTRWNDDMLNKLKEVQGSAFEAIYTGDIIK